jgi:hypothetical protein
MKLLGIPLGIAAVVLIVAGLALNTAARRCGW